MGKDSRRKSSRPSKGMTSDQGGGLDQSIDASSSSSFINSAGNLENSFEYATKVEDAATVKKKPRKSDISERSIDKAYNKRTNMNEQS